MKASFLSLLVAISVGLGAVIYLERQKVSRLEQASATYLTDTADLAAQRDRDREEIRRLREQLEVFKAESETLRAQLASAKSASPATGDPQATGAADTKPADGKQFMKGLAKMFTDPEMKKSMRVQQMVGLRMIYGDLAKELGLSAADAEQLMEMLADRQMDLSASAMGNMDPNAPDRDEKTKKLAETQQRYNEQLKAVLGEENFKKFQSYEGSIGDRFMLQQFEGQFAAAGAPLEAAQKNSLLGLMREERTKSPDNLMNSTNPQQQFDTLKSDAGVQKFMTSQEEFNRRVLNRARDVLNADQVATLEKVQQQQLEFMKVQMKMSREMLGLGK
ncbi:MAG: hypothetical protein ABMA13_12030 [Chthoniobacteraceae bacterium]